MAQHRWLDPRACFAIMTRKQRGQPLGSNSGRPFRTVFTLPLHARGVQEVVRCIRGQPPLQSISSI
eukprot:6798009-Alexandrium_andersonii.AAC.1